MKCPPCGEEMTIGKKGYFCEECGFKLSFSDVKEIEKKALIQVSVTSPNEEAIKKLSEGDILKEIILFHYPFPIAYSFRLTIDKSNSPSSRLISLISTFYQTLRFTSLILLSDYLHSSTKHSGMIKPVRSMRAPCISNWIELQSALIKYIYTVTQGKGGIFIHKGNPFSPELIMELRELSRLRFSSPAGKNITPYETFRLFRNKDYGHRASITDKESEELIDIYFPHLLTILKTIHCLSKIKLSRLTLRKGNNTCLPSRAFSLKGGFEPFPTFEVSPSDKLKEVISNGTDLWLEKEDSSILPIFPLFTGEKEEKPSGYLDPILLFDGFKKGSLVYLGTRSWSESKEGVTRFYSILKEKDIDPHFTVQEITPWGLYDWAWESSLRRLEELTRKKYFPECYAVRPCDNTVEKFLSLSPLPSILIVAEAGMGKTCLLCHLTEKLHSEESEYKNCVILLTGQELRGKDALMKELWKSMGISSEVRDYGELFKVWGKRLKEEGRENYRLIFLLDALNEGEDLKGLLEEIDLMSSHADRLNRQFNYTTIKLVASIRHHAWWSIYSKWEKTHSTLLLAHEELFYHSVDDRKKEVPYCEMEYFDENTSKKVYLGLGDYFGKQRCNARWEEFSQEVKKLLEVPLMIWIFHRAFNGSSVVPSSIGSDSLWGKYFSTIMKRKPGLERWILEVSSICFKEGRAYITSDEAHNLKAEWIKDLPSSMYLACLDPLEQLLDEEILRPVTEEKGFGLLETSGYSFCFQSLAEETFEYAILKQDREIDSKVIEKWLERADNFSELQGAIVNICEDIMGEGKIDIISELDCKKYVWKNILSLSFLGLVILYISSGKGSKNEIRWQRCFKNLKNGNFKNSFKETLSNIFLWDISKRIENIPGSLNTLKKILYFSENILQNLCSIEPGRTDLQRELAVSFIRLGDINIKLGKGQKALEYFEKSLKIIKHLCSLEPERTDLQRQLAISYSKLGGINERSGKGQKALEYFEKFLEIIKHLCSLEPGRTDLQSDLAVSYSKLGDINKQLGKEQKTLEYFEKSLEIIKHLCSLEPGRTDLQNHLAVSFIKLGDINKQLGKEQKALEYFEKSLEIIKYLCSLEPERTDLQRHLAVSYSKLGGINERSGKEQKALEYFEKSLEIIKYLCSLEPERTDLQNDLTASYSKLGDINKQLGKEQKALEYFEKSLEIIKYLCSLEPERTDLQRNFAVSYERLGDINKQLEKGQKALEYFEKNLKIIKHLCSIEPTRTDLQSHLATSYYKLGDINIKLGKGQKALEYFEKFLEIIKHICSIEPTRTDLQRDLAVSYSKLGDSNKKLGNKKEALIYYRESLKIIQYLYKLEPYLIQWNLDIEELYYKIGNIYSSSEDEDKGRKYFRKALGILLALKSDGKLEHYPKYLECIETLKGLV